jgi:hypothetical protein
MEEQAFAEVDIWYRRIQSKIQVILKYTILALLRQMQASGDNSSITVERVYDEKMHRLLNCVLQDRIRAPAPQLPHSPKPTHREIARMNTVGMSIDWVWGAWDRYRSGFLLLYVAIASIRNSKLAAKITSDSQELILTQVNKS